MEIRITLEGGEGPEQLARWLAEQPEAAWRVQPGRNPDEVVVDLDGEDVADDLVDALCSWLEGQTDRTGLIVRGMGTPLVLPRDFRPAGGIQFGDVSGGSVVFGNHNHVTNTPPGPVNDPEDDWPRD